MFDNHGKTVIVTGAGGGIGEGMALALGKSGANVVIAARRAATGEPVAAEIRRRGGEARCIVTDVSDRASVETMVAQTVETYGGLDSMIHNALSGRSPEGTPLAEIEEDHFDDVVGVAIRGTLYSVRAALPHLKPGKGSIVLLLAHGGVRGHGVVAMYGIAKGMQRGLFKSLAWELGKRKVNVNAIVPFAMSDGLRKYRAEQPVAFAEQTSRVAMGYIGEPEQDVGGAAAFLVSDEAKYITGQSLFVDGGTYFL